MSQNLRRSLIGTPWTQPSILKPRKRKNSENGLESNKVPRKEPNDMFQTEIMNNSPLEDVTSTSLNVEKVIDRAITPENIPADWHRFRGLTCYPTPQTKRSVPLPNLMWADREQVWELMCQKDKRYKKSPLYLTRHPSLQPRMRSILLDWLAEVCEVYRLHRETYYLATDYIDRFLTISEDLPKHQLQLTGVTCLFIAAKIEEIYPPKLSEFAYVTDGACTDSEILDKELVVLKVLNWDLTPVTSNCWLNTFLQLLHELMLKDTKIDPIKAPEEENDFVFPRYSGLTFVQVSRLLDLCILDLAALNFSPSKLAASALCYLTTPKLAHNVSGYTKEDLQDCHDWMAAYAYTVQEMGTTSLKLFNQVHSDDVHNIQTHAVTLETLEMAQHRQSQIEMWRRSPPTNPSPPDVLTPPKSDEKRDMDILVED